MWIANRMVKTVLRLLAMLMVLGTPAFAIAKQTGDLSKGLAYAKENCTECHAILRGERISPAPNVLTFGAIAHTPGMTGTALAVWFRTPHPTMPNFIIAPADRDNLIAYILSLRNSQL
jgi:mono/diheme cytochrome c family protein